MFKTLSKDYKDTYVYVQGAFSKNSNHDISGVVFQNYDDDTRLTYNMAAVTVKDNYGNNVNNGYGNLVFHTCPGDNNLTERLRILHDGRVGINTQDPQSLLHVNGDLRVASRVICDSLQVGLMTLDSNALSHDASTLTGVLQVSQGGTGAQSLSYFSCLVQF